MCIRRGPREFVGRACPALDGTMRRNDNPHDTLFKDTFSRPEEAAPLLRHALPDHISQRVHWGQLKLQDSSVRGDHGELRADLGDLGRLVFGRAFGVFKMSAVGFHLRHCALSLW